MIANNHVLHSSKISKLLFVLVPEELFLESNLFSFLLPPLENTFAANEEFFTGLLEGLTFRNPLDDPLLLQSCGYFVELLRWRLLEPEKAGVCSDWAIVRELNEPTFVSCVNLRWEKVLEKVLPSRQGDISFWLLVSWLSASLLSPIVT